MKFKVQIREANQQGIACEDAQVEPFKLKKPTQVQINDQNDFKRQVYLLMQDVLSSGLSGARQSNTSQAAVKQLW